MIHRDDLVVAASRVAANTVKSFEEGITAA